MNRPEVGSPNFVEHSVLVKPNKKTRTLKALILLSALIVFSLYFTAIYIIAKPVLGTVPVALVLISVAIWYFWRYASPEYEYAIYGGDMHMTVIYGGRKRKELFCVKVSDMSLISDCDGSVPREAERAEKVFLCVSDVKAKNICFALFHGKDGKECVVYFEPIKKALSLLKFYNSSSYKVKNL